MDLSPQHMDNLASDLAQKYRELSDLEAVEHRGRFETWMGVDSSSVSERDRWASVQTLDLSTDIIRLKGEIRSLEMEYSHIKFRCSTSH